MIAWLLAQALAAPLRHADTTAWDGWLQTHHASVVHRSTWTSPTDRTRRGVAELLQGLARRREACSELEPLARRAEGIGWALTVHEVGEGPLHLVLEDPQGGGGLFVLRCGVRDEAGELVVQAPHTLHDVGTDEVAIHAFAAGEARLLMLNTVHRYRAQPDEQPADPVHPADVTRQPSSPFHTAALAWAAALPTARFVQLHGYGAGHTDAWIVLSSGDAERPPRALEAPTADALGTDTASVEIFGAEGQTLGGTANVLARALLPAPTARFVHVELDRATRDRLRADPAAATRLVHALGSVSWTF